MKVIAAVVVAGLAIGCSKETAKAPVAASVSQSVARRAPVPVVGDWVEPIDYRHQFFSFDGGLGVSFQQTDEGQCHVYLKFRTGSNAGRTFAIRGVSQDVCADTQP